MEIDKDIPIPVKPEKTEKPKTGRQLFQKGHNLATGRPKGSKNRITNDVRQCFHKVYERMGSNLVNPDTGKPLTGDDAMLEWARLNPTEFYRLYGKMIPQSAELPADMHEDFIDDLIFEEEQPKHVEVTDVTDITNGATAKLVPADNATDMGNEGQKQLTDGETSPDIEPENADNAPLSDKPDYMP